jgi:hypothetical protein
MCIVTIFALISFFVMPESRWLPKNRISHFIDSKGAGSVQTVEEAVGPFGRRQTVQRDGDETESSS